MSNTEQDQTKKWKIAVVKFSGSPLAKPEEIHQLIHDIYAMLRIGYRVLAVVSATEDTLRNHTYTAILEPDELEYIPPFNEFAEFLATGENAIACTVAMGLDRAGISTKKLNHQCLLTKYSVLNSEPASLSTDLIISLFKRYSVLVLPGAIGHDEANGTTLLGRSGADYTAIFAAISLRADNCILYKNIDDIYEQYPQEINDNLRRYESISYTDLLKLPVPILNHKALKFAKSKKFCFNIRSLISSETVTIGPELTTYRKEKQHCSKLKVALFGLGNIGTGVYKHLLIYPHLFELVGIGVYSLSQQKYSQYSKALLTDNWDILLSRECQVVIDLMSNTESALELIKRALMQGCHVITANKALLADMGQELRKLAKKNKVQFLYSATIGGSIPLLETLHHLRENESKNPILSITDVIDNTFNFILEKIKDGQTFNNMLNLTKALGLENSKPTLNAYCEEALKKALIITHAAFGRAPDLVDTAKIQQLNEKMVHEAEAAGKSIQLMLRCSLEKNNIIKVVFEPVLLEKKHPLAHTSGEANAILIQTKMHGVIEFHGKSAGRWPIAEAVFADLLALSMSLCKQTNPSIGHILPLPTFQGNLENISFS